MIFDVGLLQSPGYPRHSAQALHFARLSGRGLVAEPVSNHAPGLGGGMETPMSEVTLYGFPRSVYVQMAGIVLTHHEVAYAFYDLETEMNTPAHLALHGDGAALFRAAPALRRSSRDQERALAKGLGVDHLTPSPSPARRGEPSSVGLEK